MTAVQAKEPTAHATRRQHSLRWASRFDGAAAAKKKDEEALRRVQGSHGEGSWCRTHDVEMK